MADKDKTKAFMEADFLPGQPAPTAEHRVANALEYIAYHMGQIDKKLDRVIAGLEMVAHSK
ncbi:MAG TPA: hypothetical protein VKZ79_24470 [Alphaproteobacteria bacterium]|nr:hypothetical protein [Alphaproteobacteria bacterium]